MLRFCSHVHGVFALKGLLNRLKKMHNTQRKSNDAKALGKH